VILVGRLSLKAFSEKHPVTRRRLEAWSREVKVGTWQTPHDVKARYPRASVLPGDRLVFDIGQAFRLGVQMNYATGLVVVRRVGTHEEYESWGDAW
jgi:mRNA interferase HigB